MSEQSIRSIYEEKPFIKIMKMSKGYQWEIKVIGDDDAALAKIKKLDLELNKTYGTYIE